MRGDRMKDMKAKQARVRIDAERKHLTDELEAIKRPRARLDQVQDVHGHGKRGPAHGHRR